MAESYTYRLRARKRKYETMKDQAGGTPFTIQSGGSASHQSQIHGSRAPNMESTMPSPDKSRNDIMLCTSTSPMAAQTVTVQGILRSNSMGQTATGGTPATHQTNEESFEDSPGQPPNGSSFINLSKYYGKDFSVSGNDSAGQGRGNQQLSQADMDLLHNYNAFRMPSPAWRQSLIENFLKYCQPWMPIVEREWLEESKDYVPSILLLKAVLVAGGQFNDPGLMAAECKENYAAARALFSCGIEQNPIMNLVAVMLLSWCNTGPVASVSIDSASTWHRIAVGIAYQIGLHEDPGDGRLGQYRRRLWWTLVVRLAPHFLPDD